MAHTPVEDVLDPTTKAIIDELEVATRAILEKKKGMRGSDLVKSIEYEYRDNAFVLIALDYYVYVSEGRRPRARKVPVEDLIRWIKDKGIPTRGRSVSSTAFSIQQSIYKNGIKGKKYADPVVEVSTDIISEDLAEVLSNYIVEDLVNILEQNN